MCLYVFSLRFPLPPSSTLFPYTTLFRSCVCRLLSPRIGSNMAEAFIILGSIIDWLTCSGHHVLPRDTVPRPRASRSEEHTSELQSHSDLVCRLLLEKKNNSNTISV